MEFNCQKKEKIGGGKREDSGTAALLYNPLRSKRETQKLRRSERVLEVGCWKNGSFGQTN